MAKYTFKLLQHTPIIHFKPGDLPVRGTELKPAFDKFLNITKKNRYKVRIRFNNLKSFPINFRNSMYFGRGKKYVWADVEVEFFSFDNNMIEQIKREFPKFVSQYNFASRKTKGYGSFTTGDGFIPPKNKKIYYFQTSNWERDLKLFYMYLRQGINYPGKFYSKPLIFKYACDKGFKWEKKLIKESLSELNITNPKVRHQPITCKNDDLPAIIARDAFGLSTNQTWMDYKTDNINISIVKEHNQGKIARFASPIFFKPVKINGIYRVYFWVNNELYNLVKDADFTLKIKAKKEVLKNLGSYNILNIDWEEFLDKDKYLNVEVLDELVSDRYKKDNNYSTLKKIIQGIKNV